VKAKFTITTDLGGTKILSSLLTESNEIIDRVKIPTDASQGAEFIVESIAKSVKKILKKNNKKPDQVKAICLGVPGTVDPQSGIIGNAPNLGVKNFNIKKELSKYYSIPILIENDVNLAALGIKRFEFKDNVKNMLIVFIGTGIGGALIFNGKMYRGSSFFAGEIGHMKVCAAGGLSSESGVSTFENLASRTAIVKAIKSDMDEGAVSLLKDLEESKIKSKTIANALKEGDGITIKHIDKACEVIGSVLGSVTTLLNIDTIVLGGGVIEAMNEYMIPRISEAFNKSVLPEPGKFAKIIATKLGDDAPLYGGISLADEFVD
jgi:glucokinase